MKTKIRLAIEILLVIAAAAILCYNISTERRIAYMASIVALCGTLAILARDIYSAKKAK